MSINAGLNVDQIINPLIKKIIITLINNVNMWLLWQNP